MTILTAAGAFAKAYTDQFDADIVSIREVGEATFKERIKKADIIIHNASTINVPDLELSVELNFDFTRWLIELVQSSNPSVHIILISSMSLLDPTNENAYGDVVRMSPYAYSKYLAETYSLKSGLQHLSCVRFSTLFYKQPDRDILSKLIVDAVTKGKIQLINNGEARRNFLPLVVAARYVQKILEFNKNDPTIFNLTAPESVSFGDVAAILRKLLPDLIVENIEMPVTPPVLSEFTNTSIDTLGRVDFSLETEITNYAKSLRP